MVSLFHRVTASRQGNVNFSLDVQELAVVHSFGLPSGFRCMWSWNGREAHVLRAWNRR